MVEYEDKLYVFGGEISFCNDQEMPLWIFDIEVRYFLTKSGLVDFLIPRQEHGKEEVPSVGRKHPSHYGVIQPQCTKTPCSYLVDTKT